MAETFVRLPEQVWSFGEAQKLLELLDQEGRGHAADSLAGDLVELLEDGPHYSAAEIAVADEPAASPVSGEGERTPRDGRAIVAVLRRLGLVLEETAGGVLDWQAGLPDDAVWEHAAAERFVAELERIAAERRCPRCGEAMDRETFEPANELVGSPPGWWWACGDCGHEGGVRDADGPPASPVEGDARATRAALDEEAIEEIGAALVREGVTFGSHSPLEVVRMVLGHVPAPAEGDARELTKDAEEAEVAHSQLDLLGVPRDDGHLGPDGLDGATYSLAGRISVLASHGKAAAGVDARERDSTLLDWLETPAAVDALMDIRWGAHARSSHHDVVQTWRGRAGVAIDEMLQLAARAPSVSVETDDGAKAGWWVFSDPESDADIYQAASGREAAEQWLSANLTADACDGTGVEAWPLASVECFEVRQTNADYANDVEGAEPVYEIAPAREEDR